MRTSRSFHEAQAFGMVDAAFTLSCVKVNVRLWIPFCLLHFDAASFRAVFVDE